MVFQSYASAEVKAPGVRAAVRLKQEEICSVCPEVILGDESWSASDSLARESEERRRGGNRDSGRGCGRLSEGAGPKAFDKGLTWNTYLHEKSSDSVGLGVA